MKKGIMTVFLWLVIVGNVCFIDIRGAYSQDIDNSELIRQTVEQTKAVLPLKVDAMTTFTDIIGGNNSLTYMYEVDMDLSLMPPQQLAFLKEKFPVMICQQMTPMMCGVGKVFFEKGITITTEYKVKDGSRLAKCRYSKSDCDNLPRK